MNLLIETDLGHDPDDFFAICYLISTGVNVRGITIVPGSPDQIAIAKFIANECGLDIPVGASKPDTEKLSSGSVHHHLLEKYKKSKNAKADDHGYKVIEDCVQTYNNLSFFVIGPCTNVKNYLKNNPSAVLNNLTMQGGFLPYRLYEPTTTLEKFLNKEYVPTFNMNGDKEGTLLLKDHFCNRRYVGKNICHTILFEDTIFREKFIKPKDRASELFCEAARWYLQKQKAKVFHDPTAAICMLHSDVGIWYNGEPFPRTKNDNDVSTTEMLDYLGKMPTHYFKNEWTTIQNNNFNTKGLADIDLEKMWSYIGNWT